MGRPATSVALVAPCQARRVRQLQRRSMAVPLRRLRCHRRLEPCRDSAPLSRPAAAAIYDGPARDAVVPEQTDHPQVDASGVAARRAQTKENGPSCEPGFPAGPGLRIAPAGAIAGSAEIREPG